MDEVKENSVARLPIEEEKELITDGGQLKSTANGLFGEAKYSEAIDGYNRAFDKLPTYLDYELAVLKSNIAACHLKLSEWKAAIEAATLALDKLDQVDPLPKLAKETDEKEKIAGQEEQESASTNGAAVVEIDDATAERQEILSEVSRKTLNDVSTLRVKTLLRRAKGRSEEGGWSNLQGALEDYQLLSTSFPNLSSIDRATVTRALRELPPKLEDAKSKEMADMMGKLKDLGNGILRPFGLSTNNFQFVKDEKTGGYSMNFKQNPES